jgi:2-oxoglutarate ferredoxin oxidoreductase subunit beta
MKILAESHEKGEVLTGVLYVNTQAPSFIEVLNLTDQPLGQLPEKIVRPPKKVLEEAMAELM